MDRLSNGPISEDRTTALSAIRVACLSRPRRTKLLVGHIGMLSEPTEWLSSTSEVTMGVSAVG